MTLQLSITLNFEFRNNNRRENGVWEKNISGLRTFRGNSILKKQ